MSAVMKSCRDIDAYLIISEPLLAAPFERRTPATGLDRAANGVMDNE